MNIDEFIQEQNEKLSFIQKTVIAIAAQDTHAKMIERIFEDGKNSKGEEIGVYEYSKPIYVNPKKSPKAFPPTGKNGSSKFEDGTLHKTGFFTSYQDYRNAIGRQSGKVDLTLSGLLKSDFSRAVVRISDSVYASKVASERSINIIKGVQDKYGDVFGLSEDEKENFIEVVKYEALAIIKSA